MFDFVTQLWPGASRAPAGLPERLIDDPWKVSGKPAAKKRKASSKGPAKKRQALPPADGRRDGIDAVILALIASCRDCGRSWGTLSVSELADAMQCSVGESSKRVKEAAGSGSSGPSAWDARRSSAFTRSLPSFGRRCAGVRRQWRLASIIGTPSAGASALRSVRCRAG
jgi:hypothetical protein